MPISGPAITLSSPLAQDAVMATIMGLTRKQYGDYGSVTAEDHTMDGTSRVVDLADDVIEPTGLIVTLNGTPLSAPTQYILDSRGGTITLTSVPNDGDVVSVTGTNYQFNTDEELTPYVLGAIDKHISGKVVTGRSRDPDGFIAYSHAIQSLVTLPRVEQPLVAMLAAIDALWDIAADAEYDIDVNTADSTALPRMERFNAINQMIERLTDRYRDISGQLGVGLWRIRTIKQRRVSLTTMRLVPLYVPREIDDPAFVTRILEPIDTPAGTLTSPLPAQVFEYDPSVDSGNPWSATIELDGIDMTNGVVPKATIFAGQRTSAIIPIAITVVDATHCTLSLTAAITATLPPYAPWTLTVTYLDGTVLPVMGGTFLCPS